MTDPRLDAVERFYDFHPINAKQILDAVAARGIAQEAFAHIPDKARLLAECARVLQPGGRLVFSDILHRGNLTADDARRLLEGMTFSEIETLDGYAEQLSLRGIAVVRLTDLTEEWTRILVVRHAMCRSLESDTVARLGREHFERYDRAYEHFVGLYQSGVLAGALVHAVKAR